MKKYILVSIVASLLFSCGEPYSEEDEEFKSFSFSYDFDKKMNDIELMNMHTLVKEDDNTFSRINEINVHSFGIQIPGLLLTDFSGSYATVSARIKKTDRFSDLTLVISCDDNTGNIKWDGIPVDSTYATENNEWFNFSFDNFDLPEEIKNDAVIKVYFWTIDGKQVDIDDFKFEIIEEEEYDEEYL